MVRFVHRTARIRLRTTRAQRRRCFGLLRSAGDVRAWVIDCNREILSWGLLPITNYQALCRELAGTCFGELDMVGARSVLRRYSAEWFEAAKRRKAGIRAGFPRRKKALVPVRYYHGTFALTGVGVRLPTARGSPLLSLRLARPLPYPEHSVRSVTLVAEAGRLFLDVTAEVAVTERRPDKGRVAGVDVGIIHPFAAACADGFLLVSGRAVRAEERLHLEDTKRRAAKMGRKAPKKRESASRRYRKLRASQKRAEAKHLRRVRKAHHQAAKQLVAWAKGHGVGTLVIGDLRGITGRNTGKKQNLRIRQWRRSHLTSCLKDKAELEAIEVLVVDERGTSSTCPQCKARSSKPSGRNFRCNRCGFTGHRDLLGARNIAAQRGGKTSADALVTHRRAGAPPTRRDRRRHLFDARRSCPAPGRPRETTRGSRSPRRRLEKEAHSSSGSSRVDTSTLGEDSLISSCREQGERLWTEH